MRKKELFFEINAIIKRHSSSQKQEPKIFSKTLNLPSTNFPLWVKKEDRTKYDERIEKDSDFDGLYEWQRNNISGTEYVLHDGPPYANGPAHIGHAINKILKDVIIRYNLLNGRKIHYKPGWDCHGLPIELKALLDVQHQVESIPVLDIRNKARNFASFAIKQQKDVFKTWGILTDWTNQCYFTYDKNYVKNQIQQFYVLYKKKLIYRDLKPVYWSPSSRTALAEAELEYNKNHISNAITVRLKIDPSTISESFGVLKKFNLYALIWTTTPWTLPANKAIAFSESLTYSVIKFDETGDAYLMCTDLIPSLEQLIKKPAQTIFSIPEQNLSNFKYEHPLQKKTFCPFVPGTHVSSSKGTGLVHIAPAHGPEDFVLGLKHKLSMDCIVNELGCYTKEAGEILKGLNVLEEGSNFIMDILKEDTLCTESFEHSYPYDWRTKKPVIIRASDQWFIDTEALKKEATKCLENVSILPKQNSTRLSSLLETRPFWCISRQRKWGVPIPVLYDKKTFNPIVERPLIDHYCNLIDTHGTDFWWKLPIEEIVPSNSYHVENFVKGEDILDIWFDSGISWSSVLENDQVADMYLEGIDQCSGWFQSSLITSVGVRNKAPFKRIFIHGFAVDKEGRKMSKSLGNVVDPQDLIQGTNKQPAYGIDVLRWWVASHAVQHNQIPVTSNTFSNSQENVQKLRFIIRFLLGNLNRYSFENSPKTFWILDKHMLHNLYIHFNQIQDLYNQMELNKICALILNFITNEVSAIYSHLTKDRLYCEAEYSLSRTACQDVCFNILEFILYSIAPIIPHLAEETYLYHPIYINKSSYFRSKHFELQKDWNNSEIFELVQLLLNVKKEISLLKPKKLKLSQLDVNVNLSAPINEILNVFSEAEILEILQVSSITTHSEGSEDFKIINIEETKNKLCERCRKYSCTDDQQICFRCSEVVDKNVIVSCN